MGTSILIHSCPERRKYVDECLVPSMIEQGIDRDDIVVWTDWDRVGNLASCIESFKWAEMHRRETWHLQDDVIICRDFAERIRGAPDGVVCGFCADCFEDCFVPGPVMPLQMWQSSFPCIKIPDDIAGDFARWVTGVAGIREDLRPMVETGRKDDTLFRIYMLEEHYTMPVYNMLPHLVDHVDYLIGGSVINKWRGYIARSSHFEDEYLITELKRKLASR